jgi:hypothetical protein
MMASARNPVDRALHFMRLLGWSFGDVSDNRGRWTVFAHRDEEGIVVRVGGQGGGLG